MKIIAAIHADFERSPLGTRSRLDEDLCGETVLRRTLQRVLAASRPASVHLLVHRSQHERARQAADGLNVKVETHEAAPVPWQAYVASGRKWSMDGWLGGLGGTSVFDESLHPWVLEALCRREQADGIADIPPSAVLLDPKLLDALIEHFEKVHADARLAVTQSAPGLSAAIYAPGMLADLAKAGQPVGRSLGYVAGKSGRDISMLPCFYTPATDIRNAWGRCLADTDAATHRIRVILDAAGSSAPPDAATVSAWLLGHLAETDSELPEEVEIELTTEDPLPDTTLRPRGARVGSRGPMPEAVFDRLVEELAGRDDLRVVIGGFGDPLMHPAFGRMVRRCRKAGIFGLAVRTPAATLNEGAIDALLDARVDVLNVLLDANTPETYRDLHRADHFDAVRARLEQLFDARAARKQPQPLLACEMIKTRATLDEMEPFYDGWLSRGMDGVITGPSDYAGQFPNLAVMDMAPPTRLPCVRLFTRACVLADGRVTICDQDFKGLHPVGAIAENRLADLWNGKTLSQLRDAHRRNTFDHPLCSACREWHRP